MCKVRVGRRLRRAVARGVVRGVGLSLLGERKKQAFRIRGERARRLRDEERAGDRYRAQARPRSRGRSWRGPIPRPGAPQRAASGRRWVCHARGRQGRRR